MATLTGGTTGIPPLYYSSTSSIAYIVGASLLSDIVDAGQDFGSTIPAGQSGTEVANSNAPVLTITETRSTVTAANYDAIVQAALGPVTLYVTNSTASGGTGSTSVLAGSGGGQVLMADNSNATIVAGDGNFWVGHQNYDGTLNITLGNGDDTVNDLFGNSTIETGTGSTIINLYEDSALISLNGLGYDTINAGTGYETVSVLGDVADHVLISENLSHLSFTNGSAAATIRGGNGFTTINAGGTGSVLYTAEAYDFFIGSESPSLLSDSVVDNSDSADTLVAGAGVTYVNASGTGASVTIISGSGSSTLTGSLTRADTFEVKGLAVGTHSITINNWTASDSFEIQGFGQVPLTPSEVTVLAGNTVVTLADGTIVTFTGVSNSAEVTTHTTSI